MRAGSAGWSPIEESFNGSNETMPRNYLVIGGSRGIGVAIVDRLLTQGHHVTVWSRSRGELDGIASSDQNLRHVAVDVVSASLPTDSIAEQLDGLVYCPGSIHLGSIRSVDVQRVRDDFELNVVGAIRCFQAALSSLKRASPAAAVFFSTIAVSRGLAMHTAVAAAKGALEGLVRTWAAELAPSVRVNAIAPALVDTSLAANLLSSDERRAAMASRYPAGRIGTAADIAAAALYLLDKENDWVTGQVLAVDGGMSRVIKL